MPTPMGLPPAARSSCRNRRCVTCTVVSVMPYILTKAGIASPTWSNQGFNLRGSRASPPKITVRNARPVGVGPPSSPGTCISCRNADGVWFNTVTC